MPQISCHLSPWPVHPQGLRPTNFRTLNPIGTPTCSFLPPRFRVPHPARGCQTSDLRAKGAEAWGPQAAGGTEGLGLPPPLRRSAGAEATTREAPRGLTSSPGTSPNCGTGVSEAERGLCQLHLEQPISFTSSFTLLGPEHLPSAYRRAGGPQRAEWQPLTSGWALGIGPPSSQACSWAP